MSQYTFSFTNSEYERIPLQLRETLDAIIDESDADEKTVALVDKVCEAFEIAIADLAKYAKDQLHL